MRVFHVGGAGIAEIAQQLPASPPASGFVWIGLERAALDDELPPLQSALQAWGIAPVVDLHVSDMRNAQLPSRFDYTSWYDLLVFRRLAAAAVPDADPDAAPGLDAIDTSPVAFVVFDQVLITVDPAGAPVREYFATRLAGAGARLPTTPAELMLRMVNHIVDSYLDLRRLLTRHLAHLQEDLFDPRARFGDWPRLLQARNALSQLEDICEDQRAAVQDWIDGLADWPAAGDDPARRERELLGVRSRDVLEHIERVLSHVRRLAQTAETAVQMHFSAVSNRTNDIMRALTVMTAVFLPLNLITGFFGMNFEFLPLIHTSRGFWAAFITMVVVGAGLAWFFWRKRYVGRRR